MVKFFEAKNLSNATNNNNHSESNYVTVQEESTTPSNIFSNPTVKLDFSYGKLIWLLKFCNFDIR